MLWFVLSFIGAIADAGYYISVKKFLQFIDPFILATGSFFFAGIFLFIISLFQGFPTIGHDFLGAIFISSFLGILAVLLSYSALQSTDISLSVPMISFTPFFLIVTAIILLHEIPSLMGVVGIVTIVIGSYMLNLPSAHKSLIEPFRSVFTNRGVLLMLVVAFLYAVSVNFDKIIMLNSDATFGSSIVYLIMGTVFACILSLKRFWKKKSLKSSNSLFEFKQKDRTEVTKKVLQNIWQCILIAVFLSLAAVSINIAYNMQIVPYVIAIKRTSIIIIVLYGGYIFRECELMRRFIGAVFMVVGAVLIVLFN